MHQRLYTATSDAFEDSSELTVQLTSFDVDEFAENGTTPEAVTYSFVSAFIDDLDVVYDQNDSSQLSGSFRNLGGGQLTDNQSISFVSAKITSPNDSNDPDAPSTVTTDVADIANVGGLTIDSVSGTWLFDASHADYQDLDISTNQTTEILVEYSIATTGSANEDSNFLRLRVYPVMEDGVVVRNANVSAQIDTVQGLKYYNIDNDTWESLTTNQITNGEWKFDPTNNLYNDLSASDSQELRSLIWSRIDGATSSEYFNISLMVLMMHQLLPLPLHELPLKIRMWYLEQLLPRMVQLESIK